MSLTEILEEVTKLEPEEQDTVFKTLLRERKDLTERERQERFLQHLLAKGVISRIPPRKNVPRRSRPVPITGKPLSETIIEDRR